MTTNHAGWMGRVLRAAGVYNVLWGAWAILFPRHFWSLVDMEPPNYLFLWQCIGMIVGVYGVGYWVAARDPLRHWPIVLVGLLGKILGPIGFVDAAVSGAVPLRFGVTILTNDLIWWAPFAMILWRARTAARASAGQESGGPELGGQQSGSGSIASPVRNSRLMQGHGG